jgi:hypothetical protein
LLSASPLLTPASAADYLHPDDFQQESWAKTIDYLEYVDVYAAMHGKPRPPAGSHAYLYMTYVNHSGVQMLYAGLTNITMGLGAVGVTLPIQTFMLHYATADENRDIVTASSYLMLLAFNDSDTSIHTGSPDKNDTLYASFSMGFDLSSIIEGDRPALNSKTSIIPLTRPDSATWRWGMSYTNLTAIWWQVSIDPTNASYKHVPVAISVYEELTFNYALTFDVDQGTASVQSSYVVGRMTDLWVVDTWFWFLPVIVHYNDTGCYRPNGALYSEETIHQFLHRQDISMSMVFFQASAILDHLTESTANGEAVDNGEVFISDGTIATYSSEGEHVADMDFGSKRAYALLNHTADTTEEYDAVVRTVNRYGFARNPIFTTHTFLMRYIPLALAHMDQPLYEQAKNQLLNMTYADYFYVVAYPTYDGYTVDHDPLYTIYYAPATAAPGPQLGGFILLGAVVITGVAAAMAIKRRH